MSKESTDIVGQIMAFEQGELDNEEVYSLFQFLLDSGMIHSLQGSYQRMAEDLLLAGVIEMPQHRNQEREMFSYEEVMFIVSSIVFMVVLGACWYAGR